MQTDGSVDTQRSTKQQGLNLPTLLQQHKLGSSSDNSGFAQQRRPDLSGVSLSQLMSGHVQKSKEDGQSFRLPPLSALTNGSTSPSANMCNQNRLSLGTLASLNMPSGVQSSAPSLLSIPLSNLSLNNSASTTTSSSLARSGLSLGSLLSTSGVNHSSSEVGGQAKMVHPKGSPSLSDLIREHSNCSSSAETAAAPAPVLSLSELAARHQGRNAHIQLGMTGKPDSLLSSTISPASVGGGIAITQLALQHQANSRLTETEVSAFIEPRASLAAPCAPARSSREGVTKHKLSHRNPRSSKPRQTVDVGMLVEHRDDLSCLFSEALSSLSRKPSVVAKPSVFAWALSFQSHRLRKRRNILRNQRTGRDHQDLGGERQELSTTLSPITPFLFDSPSPDDIIRTNQLKAFTR